MQTKLNVQIPSKLRDHFGLIETQTGSGNCHTQNPIERSTVKQMKIEVSRERGRQCSFASR